MVVVLFSFVDTNKGRSVQVTPDSAAPSTARVLYILVRIPIKIHLLHSVERSVLFADSQRLLQTSAPSTVQNITSLITPELDAEC
jgi:hypothetical protein